MPVLVGTLAYLFLDHRNARTGFGGNEGIFTWAGWIVTQPVTFLFAIPAIGMLAELTPVVFGRRMPVRGVMFAGLALVGVAALAGVTQQNIQNLPWAGSQLNVDDLETKVRDLVPFLLFNALPILGVLLVLLVVLQTARPGDGSRFNFSPGDPVRLLRLRHDPRRHARQHPARRRRPRPAGHRLRRGRAHLRRLRRRARRRWAP